MNSKAEWHQPAVGRVVVLQDLQELSGQEGRGGGREAGQATGEEESRATEAEPGRHLQAVPPLSPPI